MNQRHVLIAVVGAQNTGKTSLCQALAAQLHAAGKRAAVVTPLASSDFLLLFSAAGGQRAEVVIIDVDTAAFCVPIMSNPSITLHPLVMGLDLPTVPDCLTLQTAQDALIRGQLAAAGLAFNVIYGQGSDRKVQALRAIGRHATGVRLEPCTSSETPILIAIDQPNALARATKPLQVDEALARNATAPKSRWAWACDKCSDPECERRLFTQGLLD